MIGVNQTPYREEVLFMRRLSVAALKRLPVVRSVSTFITILLCTIALAQSTARAPQSMVKLNVLVTDKSHRPAMDLNQEDFLVFDEGRQQAISFFQKKDIPVSYGLIVDNTGSMRSRRPDVIQVAKAIVSSNRPEDRAFILRLIDGQALLAADWASDKTALLNSLNAMKSANGMMSLIDSVYAGSEEFTRQSPAEDIADRRRAIILITDGIDRGSSKKMDELLSRLHKENIQVFAVGFDSPRNTRWRAAELLETLAEKTGGRSLYLETREELEASAGLISSYLRSQYVIGYSRSRDAKNDSPRKVRVKIIDKPDRDKYSITSRLHYFLPSN